MVKRGENEWVKEYLEVILDVGTARNGKRDAESGKMIASRNSRQCNNRLENMCWCIWHLDRRKKQERKEMVGCEVKLGDFDFLANNTSDFT